MLPQGFQMAGAWCGLKNKRKDVGLIVSDRPARVAGVFTQNQIRAACVDYSRTAISAGTLRAVVVNSGNANCCTGEQGIRDTEQMVAWAAEHCQIPTNAIAVASTGVIGKYLDMERVQRGIRDAAAGLGTDPKPFMEAILTTDLVEKEASLDLSGGAKLYGVAKGSGMISPNMATMLGFIVSDADTSGFDLNAVLKRVVEKSFNALTVDGDTSTNDMVLLLTNGASGVSVSEQEFEAALETICVSLAKQIARDGEGATKLVEVCVKGTEDPKTVARTIANSPLVKTALFGCDPNWGRIVTAAGRSGVPFDPDHAKLSLSSELGSYAIFENGAPLEFDAKKVSSALKADAVRIDLDLGEGPEATIYTCDFGYGYVRINAEYHT